ncbi:ABC transporter family substrate-binding protein [Glycomyces salinus]|uniref:ABC transporter family substrate-binding protein n=1 Tax=Glycomyces salinus TaxID=980294 RepID=UPI0018EC894F|nr:ABC transporter family substrate-binding protein [Glycomyces salinus]
MERNHKAAASVAAFAALSLALTGCGEGEAAASGLADCETDPVSCNAGERADGGDVTWALDGSWTGWNLTMASDNNAYLNEALAGMWPYVGQFDPEGQWSYNDGLYAAEPELVSEDPVRVRYTLADGASWGDGEPVTARDFRYHWYATSGDDDLCEACTPADTAFGGSVADIEAEGDAVTVTYVDGYANAEWKYTDVLSSPAHIAEEEGFDWAEDPADMADSQDWFSANPPTWSTGPYRITDAEAGDHVIYEPNPDWAGETEPTLDRLTFKVIDGLDSIVTELRQGTIDGASPFSVDVDTITQLEMSDEDVSYRIDGGPNWEHLDLNTENEFLSDPDLRTAVLTAVDVENIISRTAALVQSDAQAKRNHLFRFDSEYYTDRLAATSQGSGDVDLAVDLLEDADYGWDSDGALLTPEGEPVELDIRYTQSNDTRKIISELIQANLTELGIEVDINPIPDADLGPVLFGGEFDLVVFGWSGNPGFVSPANQYWRSDSSSNFGRLDDPELDRTLAELSGTLDLDEAAALADRAVEQVVEDAYVLPIVDTPVVIMVSDRLVNVRDNWASQQRAMYNIAEWGVSES